MKVLKRVFLVLGALLVAAFAAIAAYATYESWQNEELDVVGLKCTRIFKTVQAPEVVRHYVLTRRRRSTEPNALWGQLEDDATPHQSFTVCSITPDVLEFVDADSYCSNSDNAVLRFLLNRKTLQIEFQRESKNFFEAKGPCELMEPETVREFWRERYEEKLKGNKF